MVACPAVVTSTAQEKAQYASTRSAPQTFFLSDCWPWESNIEQLKFATSPTPPLPPPPSHSHAPSTQAAAQLPARHLITSSLSSTSRSSFLSSSSSAAATSTSKSPQSHSTSADPSFQNLAGMSSLWHDDDDDAPTQLPPIHPCDHMKTLLVQLAACISSIQTAYAHQQAALNPHYTPAIHGDEQSGRNMAQALASKTDKAMMEELQNLSRLHSQLAALPHMLTVKQGAEVRVDLKKDSMRVQLKCYEGIIARFHEEMCRREAVTEALKETLAKSLLKGEKLQHRVKALEAKLTLHTH